MSARCPRCGSAASKPHSEKVIVNEWETIVFTHQCAERDCGMRYRYEEPFAQPRRPE